MLCMLCASSWCEVLPHIMQAVRDCLQMDRQLVLQWLLITAQQKQNIVHDLDQTLVAPFQQHFPDRIVSSCMDNILHQRQSCECSAVSDLTKQVGKSCVHSSSQLALCKLPGTALQDCWQITGAGFERERGLCWYSPADSR